MSPPLTSPRLSRLISRPAAQPAAEPVAEPAADAAEHCELCAAPIAERHRHLLDVQVANLLCACQACSLLMDYHAAGGSHYRLVPTESREIVDLTLAEHLWQELGVPVELVFFVDSTPREGITAFYPGALGATEAHPDPEAWKVVVAENPVLATLQPDVEAFLVRRSGGVRQGWIAPIDACFRLTGKIRSRWRGLAGGSEVWEGIQEFFTALAQDAVAVDRQGRRAATAPDPSESPSPQPKSADPGPSKPGPSTPEPSRPQPPDPQPSDPRASHEPPPNLQEATP